MNNFMKQVKKEKSEPTKKCAICKKQKVYTLFSKNHLNPNGIGCYCKECDRVRARTRLNAMYDREYSKKQYLKRKKSGKVIQNTYNMMKKYPEKFRARQLAQYAVKIGTIKKSPCEVGKEEKAQMHHPDYTKPLEIKWLCIKHHRELHRKPNIINLN
jgi:hypothetical protein